MSHYEEDGKRVSHSICCLLHALARLLGCLMSTIFNLGVQVVHRRASSRHENGWTERFLQSMGRDCGRGGHEGPEYEAF